jgi:hypothetical protein
VESYCKLNGKEIPRLLILLEIEEQNEQVIESSDKKLATLPLHPHQFYQNSDNL